MKVNEFIDRDKVTKYFILDSHDKGVPGQRGNTYADEDFIRYSFQPAQNYKLEKGAAFIYRKPGKNFRFIGGGFIETITETDSTGYKTASITRGFELTIPLQKGDPFLEDFQWKKKTKPGPGWKGFWTNYGILEIDKDDFWGLVGEMSCKPALAASELKQDSVEDAKLIIDICNSLPNNCSHEMVVNNTPKEKTTPLESHGRIYPRDKIVARNALNNAHHLCEYNNSHESFIRRGTTLKYCEPHHLVPMSFQDGFQYSLDREENVIALCSNCHNQIHYGEGARELIIALFEKRKDSLKKVGIDIDLEILLSMYGL